MKMPGQVTTWVQASLPGQLLLLAAVILASMLPRAELLAADSVAEPYSARYSVYRNGKLQARMEFLLQRQDETWVIKSESTGTHGMARFMKFRDYEFVEGNFEGQSFRPLRYVHDLKWIGPDQNTAAEFDWENGKVAVSHDGNEVTLDLVPGALDPMSLQLELRRRLGESDMQDMEFMLVEEDEIELQKFRALDPEELETSLGCLDTIPVEKIRRSSTRFTRSWHASGLGYIPVRMEHGKTDGDQMELRITELVIDGTVIDPMPGCAARQNS